jgi:hypothetical protein
MTSPDRWANLIPRQSKEEMAHICLWGNASDLSFALQGDVNVLQGKQHRTDANKNILVVSTLPAFQADSGRMI